MFLYEKGLILMLKTRMNNHLIYKNNIIFKFENKMIFKMLKKCWIY